MRKTLPAGVATVAALLGHSQASPETTDGRPPDHNSLASVDQASSTSWGVGFRYSPASSFCKSPTELGARRIS